MKSIIFVIVVMYLQIQRNLITFFFIKEAGVW